MNKLTAKRQLFLGLCVFTGLCLISAMVFIGYFLSATKNICGNDILDSVTSPDSKDKVVVFVRNCGATTEWSTQASIIRKADSISHGDIGNILRIESNHAGTWPLATKGWPIIIPEWQTPELLTVYFSRNSAVLYQGDKVGDVNVQFAPITPEFVQERNIEIRL